MEYQKEKLIKEIKEGIKEVRKGGGKTRIGLETILLIKKQRGGELKYPKQYFFFKKERAMNNKQVKENLLIELRELTLKINKLKIFLETDKFEKLVRNNQPQAELLKLQLEVMKNYEKLLVSRIANLEDIIKKEE